MFRTTTRNLIKNFGAVKFSRYYSKGIPNATKPPSRFDKSMIKPFIWVVIFGSFVTHVIDRRQQYADMQKRYILKFDILNDLINRVKNGDSSITEESVKQELRLVNRTFVKDKSLGIKEVESLISQNISNRHLKGFEIEEESLEDVWKDILEEINNDKPMKKEIVSKPVEKHVQNDDDIILDRTMLKQIRENEQEENAKFIQSTKEHVIVEKPGDLSTSAKFL